MSDNAAPLILLTRPRAASERFAAQLTQAFGAKVTPLVAPLMEIVPRDIAIDLSGVSGLIFTSDAGVTAFADRSVRRDLPAWCVGDRTAQAARDIGLTAHSAHGDAQDLIAMIRQAAPNGRLLHLHGAHTRGEVVETLNKAGLPARGLAIYDQAACPPSTTFRDAIEGALPVIVPLFSPRSAQLFAQASEGSQPGDSRCIALSPAVKAALPDRWKASCHLATTPNADAMVVAIADLISHAPWVEGQEPLV